MRIRFKILALVFMVVLATGLATALVSRNASMDIMKEEISDHLVTTAQSRLHHIESLLDGSRESVRLLASELGKYFELYLLQMATIPLMDRGVADFMLSGVVEASDRVSQCLIVSGSGKVIACYPPGAHDLDISTTDIFRNGKVEPYVGTVSPGEIAAETDTSLLLASAAPIWVNDIFYGIIMIVGGQETLFAITGDTTGLGHTGDVYLVNERGYMVTPSRFVPDAVLSKKVDLDPVRTDEGRIAEIEHTGKLEAVTTRNYRGRDVIGVYVPVPDVGWTLVVEKETAEAYAPVNSVTESIRWVLFTVLMAGAVLAIVLSRAASIPIERLRRGTQEIIRGNWDYKVGTSSSDEIGELSRAFDEMAAKLSETQRELEAYAEHLELRIHERTRDLTEANTELNRQIHDRKRIEEELREKNQELLAVQDALRMMNQNLEAQVEQRTAEIRRLLNQKEEFISQLGHDLRSPLTPLVALLPLLQEREKDPQCRTYLEVIAGNVEYMKNLIDQTLKLARVNSTDVALNVRQVKLAEVVAALLGSKAYLLTQANIKVTNRIPDDLEVCVDDLMLLEVLDNIISNSVKFMPNGGTIECRAWRQGEFVTVAISDTGIGITEDQRERIFDEFYKADESRHHLGSPGLGLTICRRIIEAHKGRMWVTSEGHNMGTTMYFTLPASVAGDDPEDASSPDPLDADVAATASPPRAHHINRSAFDPRADNGI